VTHAPERLERRVEDPARRAGLRVGDETDAAGVELWLWQGHGHGDCLSDEEKERPA
jgi:hypothetical protein